MHTAAASGPWGSPTPRCLYGLAAAVGPDRDPSAQPAQVPRGALGGDAVPAGGDPQEPAADPDRAVAALAVRTLLVLLVVAAMAKPFLETFGAVIAGRRTHRVLVLDASLSMGYTSGESSRFDQAKALAAQLVKDSRQGDAISVILMGDPPRVVIGDPSPNLGEVKKEIDELALTARRHRPGGHLRGGRPGARRLADRPEGGRLPDRPAGRELAAAGRGDRRPQAGPGPARSAGGRGRW